MNNIALLAKARRSGKEASTTSTRAPLNMYEVGGFSPNNYARVNNPDKMRLNILTPDVSGLGLPQGASKDERVVVSELDKNITDKQTVPKEMKQLFCRTLRNMDQIRTKDKTTINRKHDETLLLPGDAVVLQSLEPFVWKNAEEVLVFLRNVRTGHRVPEFNADRLGNPLLRLAMERSSEADFITSLANDSHAQGDPKRPRVLPNGSKSAYDYEDNDRQFLLPHSPDAEEDIMELTEGGSYPANSLLDKVRGAWVVPETTVVDASENNPDDMICFYRATQAGGRQVGLRTRFTHYAWTGGSEMKDASTLAITRIGIASWNVGLLPLHLASAGLFEEIAPVIFHNCHYTLVCHENLTRTAKYPERKELQELSHADAIVAHGFSGKIAAELDYIAINAAREYTLIGIPMRPQDVIKFIDGLCIGGAEQDTGLLDAPMPEYADMSPGLRAYDVQEISKHVQARDGNPAVDDVICLDTYMGQTDALFNGDFYFVCLSTVQFSYAQLKSFRTIPPEKLSLLMNNEFMTTMDSLVRKDPATRLKTKTELFTKFNLESHEESLDYTFVHEILPVWKTQHKGATKAIFAIRNPLLRYQRYQNERAQDNLPMFTGAPNIFNATLRKEIKEEVGMVLRTPLVAPQLDACLERIEKDEKSVPSLKRARAQEGSNSGSESDESSDDSGPAEKRPRTA